MRSLVLLAALLLAAPLLAGCSSSRSFDLAKAQIPHFRELTAAREFGRLYAEADNELKKNTTEQEFVRFLSAIDRKLGAVQSSEDSGWRVNMSTSGSSVVLSFKTQFEKGPGLETFTFRVAGDKALLAGYSINSNALIVN
jgi:hypothetical protein